MGWGGQWGPALGLFTGTPALNLSAWEALASGRGEGEEAGASSYGLRPPGAGAALWQAGPAPAPSSELGLPLTGSGVVELQERGVGGGKLILGRGIWDTNQSNYGTGRRAAWRVPSMWSRTGYGLPGSVGSLPSTQ